ncbi:MAG: hypothetical protein ACPGVX_00195 [Thalassobaculaceae bacterium]
MASDILWKFDGVRNKAPHNRLKIAQLFDALHSRAMEILAKCTADLLGTESDVAKQIQRAASAPDIADYRAIETAFNGLPRQDRVQIHDLAIVYSTREAKMNERFVQRGGPQEMGMDWLNK